MQQKNERKEDRRPPTNCETCIHYVYDEDYGEDVCEVDLDEDEFEAYAAGRFHRCPYYQFHDEYINVRKQI